jgi:origin recognition complex subunit 1
MYIAGMPGTGKTATVHECIGALHAEVQAGQIQRFSYVEINGMRVPTPLHAYSLLWRALTGGQLAPQAALAALERHFQAPPPACP